MLTKKQQIKLILLTQHEKYGQMLADAIESWKVAKPVRYHHGLNADTYKFLDKENPECCLLGAAFANKHPRPEWNSFSKGLKEVYNIDETCYQFIDGFDDNYGSNLDEEGYKFARKISEILFGK